MQAGRFIANITVVMAQKVDKHILNNGMVLLAEPMDNVATAAFDFMLPAGAALLPSGACGAANVAEDWIFRGAGNRDSRQLGDALDSLGLHRSSSVGTSHLTIGSTLEAGNLAKALELYGDIILRPRLEAGQFVPARQLAIDTIRALDDNPRRKVMLKLRQKFFGEPLGRSTLGNIDELEKLSAERTRQLVKHYFNFSTTIFSVAGKYDFNALCRQIDDLFAPPQTSPSPRGTQSVRTPQENAVHGTQTDSPVRDTQRRYTHIHNEGAQVHIGLMTETVRPGDEDYYNARVAVSVLSGGMSARLFTEVREKRGLCYAVGAQYYGLKEMAAIGCYAGTAPQKAQQTIECLIAEFNRLADGISEDEIQRAKVGLKSALILQSESSSSRAGAIGGDYYILGRVRTLDEIKKSIDATSVESVLDFLRRKRFGDFTVVTIGPKKVEI